MGLVVATTAGWNPPVETEWDRHYEALRAWEEGMPQLTGSELVNLLATGERLPAMLFGADDQGREWLDTLILLRASGAPWPELTPLQKVLTRERFEWAFAVLETMRSCRIPISGDFDPRVLLTEGWDTSGAAYTHEDFLRRYLPELLRHGVRARYGKAGE